MTYRIFAAIACVAILSAGCSTFESNKQLERDGEKTTKKETVKCDGWFCGNTSRPAVIFSPDVGYGGYGRGHYPGAYYQYQPPSVGYIEYIGPDPNAPGTGVWHARVNGRWKNCDGRNRDRWDSCFTPRGEANANKWGDSSAPR